MDRRTQLAKRIRARELIVAPGVYDMISARLADRLGFAALYMTGYGVTASHLGLPDAGLASYAEMVSRAQTIAAGSATPLIADAAAAQILGIFSIWHDHQGTGLPAGHAGRPDQIVSAIPELLSLVGIDR